MSQEIKSYHGKDMDGNPAGGRTRGVGIDIRWQDGPLNRGADRLEPNGAFVEGVIAAALDRLEFYQSSKFKCDLNAKTIICLESALKCCEQRTADREKREVEGTHAI
jgi:hypothetical protein